MLGTLGWEEGGGDLKDKQAPFKLKGEIVRQYGSVSISCHDNSQLTN